MSNLERHESASSSSSDHSASNAPEEFKGIEEPSTDTNGHQDAESNLSRYESTYTADRSLSRVMTGADKLIEEANNTDVPLPLMGGDKPYPPALPDREPYMVEFDGPDDHTNPLNFSLKKKVIFTACVGYCALTLSLGSAMFSQATPDLMINYHIGATTATLGTSLFVFGFASGPVIFGPLSELYGRKPILILCSFLYTCFSFAVATSKDIQSIMICRFFAGFCGAAALVVSPAVMSDMFNAKQRGMAISFFSAVLFGGPMLAPIMGAFTVKNSGLGWRWTSYFCGIIGGASCIFNIIILEETHPSVILVKKAETLRRRTGNWGIFAAHEEVKPSIKEIFEQNISRPIVMLITEPILLLITIYNAFIYGMLYLFLTAIPLVFSQGYKFRQGVAELPYLAMFIGILLGTVVLNLFDARYARAMDANGGKPVPEERLPPMMIGGIFFTIGLFWLGWTGQYADHIHWIVPTIGTGFIGFGLLLVFLPCLTYIIDCYLFLAASALAGNTFLRSAFGAAFPLFARQMFNTLGVNWGATLVGCLSLIMVPVPFVFYKYGRALRSKSKRAYVL